MIDDQWTSPSGLDRAEQLRSSAEWLAEQWSHDGALLVQVGDDGLGADPDGTRLRPVRTAGAFDAQRHVFLGLVDGAPVFATATAPQGSTAPLRTLNAGLEGAWLEVAVAATSLLEWHRLDPRCAGCGAETVPETGGTTRRCTSCARVHFPRTDAAVIVAILNDRDELLLGHQASWPQGRVSLLAGFVESGESLEQAVHREMAEEAGVRLTSVRYVGSQPWPFPRSLMVGFVARAQATEITVDGHEIAYARWFSRDELDARIEDGTVTVPGAGTIAHRIIGAWRAGELAV